MPGCKRMRLLYFVNIFVFKLWGLFLLAAFFGKLHIYCTYIETMGQATKKNALFGVYCSFYFDTLHLMLAVAQCSESLRVERTKNKLQ